MSEEERLIAMLTAPEREIFLALGGPLPRRPPPPVQWHAVDRTPGAVLTRIEKKNGIAKRKDLLATRTRFAVEILTKILPP
jgi:hypothetical protein